MQSSCNVDMVAGEQAGDLQQEVSTYLPMLGVIGTQLQETVSQIETAVVGVCGNFQNMADRTRASVSKAAGFLAGFGENPSASIGFLIDQSRVTIEDLLRHIEEASAVSKAAIERMHRVEEAAKQIASSLTCLDDIALGSKLLAVNARIQAVYAGEKGAGFGGVANEIAMQARRSTETVETIRAIVSKLNDIAQSGVSDLKQMSAADRSSFERSRMQVDKALDDFQSIHEDMQRFVQEMSHESGAVADEIAASIRSLQFQDRISQRIGHVVEQLTLIQDRFSSHCEGIEGDSARILAQMSSRYTMSEERQVLHSREETCAAGEVELF